MRYRFCNDYRFKRPTLQLLTKEEEEKREIERVKKLICEDHDLLNKVITSPDFVEYIASKNKDTSIDELVEKCNSINISDEIHEIAELTKNLKKFALDFEQIKQKEQESQHEEDIRQILHKIKKLIHKGDKVFSQTDTELNHIKTPWDSIVKEIQKMNSTPPLNISLESCSEIHDILKSILQDLKSNIKPSTSLNISQTSSDLPKTSSNIKPKDISDELPVFQTDTSSKLSLNNRIPSKNASYTLTSKDSSSSYPISYNPIISSTSSFIKPDIQSSTSTESLSEQTLIDLESPISEKSMSESEDMKIPSPPLTISATFPPHTLPTSKFNVLETLKSLPQPTSCESLNVPLVKLESSNKDMEPSKTKQTPVIPKQDTQTSTNIQPTTTKPILLPTSFLTDISTLNISQHASSTPTTSTNSKPAISTQTSIPFTFNIPTTASTSSPIALPTTNAVSTPISETIKTSFPTIPLPTSSSLPSMFNIPVQSNCDAANSNTMTSLTSQSKINFINSISPSFTNTSIAPITVSTLPFSSNSATVFTSISNDAKPFVFNLPVSSSTPTSIMNSVPKQSFPSTSSFLSQISTPVSSITSVQPLSMFNVSSSQPVIQSPVFATTSAPPQVPAPSQTQVFNIPNQMPQTSYVSQVSAPPTQYPAIGQNSQPYTFPSASSVNSSFQQPASFTNQTQSPSFGSSTTGGMFSNIINSTQINPLQAPPAQQLSGFTVSSWASKPKTAFTSSFTSNTAISSAHQTKAVGSSPFSSFITGAAVDKKVSPFAAVQELPRAPTPQNAPNQLLSSPFNNQTTNLPQGSYNSAMFNATNMAPTSPFGSFSSPNQQNPNSDFFCTSSGVQLHVNPPAVTDPRGLGNTLYEDIKKEYEFARAIVADNEKCRVQFVKQSECKKIGDRIDAHLSFVLQSIRSGCWFFEALPRFIGFLSTLSVPNNNRNINVLSNFAAKEYLLHSLIFHFVTDFAVPPQDLSNQDKYCYNLANFAFVLLFYTCQYFPDVLTLLWATIVVRFPSLIADFGGYHIHENLFLSLKHCLLSTCPSTSIEAVNNEQLLSDFMHFKVSTLVFTYFLRISCHNVWYYLSVKKSVLDCWGVPRIWIIISRIVNQNLPIHYVNCEILCDLLSYCDEPMMLFYGVHYRKLREYIVDKYFRHVISLQPTNTFINNAQNMVNNFFNQTLRSEKHRKFIDLCSQTPFILPL